MFTDQERRDVRSSISLARLKGLSVTCMLNIFAGSRGELGKQCNTSFNKAMN